MYDDEEIVSLVDELWTFQSSEKHNNKRYYMILRKTSKIRVIASLGSELSTLSVKKYYKISNTNDENFYKISDRKTLKIGSDIYTSDNRRITTDGEIIKCDLNEKPNEHDEVKNLLKFINRINTEGKFVNPDSKEVDFINTSENVRSLISEYPNELNRLFDSLDSESIVNSEIIKVPIKKFKEEFELFLSEERTEKEFQALFERNKWIFSFIVGSEATNVEREVEVTKGDKCNRDNDGGGKGSGNRTTDFLCNTERGITLIEMKSPFDKFYEYKDKFLVFGKRSNFKFDELFDTIINQLIEQMSEWTIRKAAKEDYELRYYAKGVIIYGNWNEFKINNDTDINNKRAILQLKRYISSLFNIELISYDEILNSLNSLLDNNENTIHTTSNDKINEY